MAQHEPHLAEAVHAAFDGHPAVAEVRSAGLLASVELDATLLESYPRLPDAVSARCRDHGLIGRALRGVALQLSPPFVATPEELSEMVRRLRAALDDAVEQELPAGALAARA